MTEPQPHPPSRRLRLAMAVFDNILRPEELPRFRGAMIRVAEGDGLFHNHIESGYVYRYPLIQYKLFDGHPAILGIEEGADAVKQTFASGEGIHCRIGHREELMRISSVGEWEEEAGLTDEMHSYALEDWLPLNSKNFHEYRQADGIIEKLTLLQRVLIGNILSFANGVGIYLDREVKCSLQQMTAKAPHNYKGIELQGFSVAFRSNVRLPQWIGLGKSASQNHGIIIHL